MPSPGPAKKIRLALAHASAVPRTVSELVKLTGLSRKLLHSHVAMMKRRRQVVRRASGRLVLTRSGLGLVLGTVTRKQR